MGSCGCIRDWETDASKRKESIRCGKVKDAKPSIYVQQRSELMR